MKSTTDIKLSLDDVNELLQLVPEARLAGDSTAQVLMGIRLLLTRERVRQSGRDGLTGVQTHESLVRGDMLSRAHRDHRLGAFGIRIENLATINTLLGFAIGDEVVRAVAASLVAASSSSPVVRLDGDTFASLTVSDELAQPDVPDLVRAFEGLLEAAIASIETGQRHQIDVTLTMAYLDLSVISPQDTRVAGSIVAAEIRRAIAVAKDGPSTTVQVRRVELP